MTDVARALPYWEEGVGSVEAQERVQEQARDAPVRVLLVNDHLGYEGGVIHGATQLFYTILTRLDPERARGRLCILKGRHPAAERFEEAGHAPIFLGRSKWDVRALPDLIRLVRALEIDVLHLHTMKPYLLGRIAAAVTGCRAIVHFHDTNDPGRVLGPVQRALVPWTDRALAVSPEVERFAHRAYAIPEDRLRVLSNGVNVERYRSASRADGRRLRKAWSVPAEAPLIGVIGRMREDKRRGRMIKVLPELLSECPDVRVVFVGDGPTREKCEELAHAYGVEDRVVFTGYREDIPAVLQAVDMAAITSEMEGQPITILEALSAGVPIVAFAVEGVPSTIGGGQGGLVVERGDLNAFREALVRLIRDEALQERLSRVARERAEDFDAASYVDRLEEVYLDVAGRTSHPKDAPIADGRAVP